MSIVLERIDYYKYAHKLIDHAVWVNLYAKSGCACDIYKVAVEMLVAATIPGTEAIYKLKCLMKKIKLCEPDLHEKTITLENLEVIAEYVDEPEKILNLYADTY